MSSSFLPVTSPRICAVVTVTTLLLFGHVTLLCETFLCIKLSEGPVQLMSVRSTSTQYDSDSTSRGRSGPERHFAPRREIHTETEAGIGVLKPQCQFKWV